MYVGTWLVGLWSKTIGTNPHEESLGHRRAITRVWNRKSPGQRDVLG
jgi:hypothetical protein